MRVYLGKCFTTLDGEAMTNPAGEPATLCSAVVEALLATFEDERNLSGEEKLKRWENS